MCEIPLLIFSLSLGPVPFIFFPVFWVKYAKRLNIFLVLIDCTFNRPLRFHLRLRCSSAFFHFEYLEIFFYDGALQVEAFVELVVCSFLSAFGQRLNLISD